MYSTCSPVEEQGVSAERGDMRSRDGAGLGDHQVVEAAHAAVHHATHAEGVLEEVQQHWAEVPLYPTRRKEKELSQSETPQQTVHTSEFSAPGAGNIHQRGEQHFVGRVAVDLD